MSVTKPLTLGRTVKWMESFFQGYTYRQNQLLAAGIIIDESWEVAERPSLYRYDEETYRERMDQSNDAAFAKGYAVAEFLGQNAKAVSHSRRSHRR